MQYWKQNKMPFYTCEKLQEFCIMYCCVTNYPQTKMLKTTNIHFTVSGGQESGPSQLGASELRSLLRLQLSFSRAMVSPEARLDNGLLPSSVTQTSVPCWTEGFHSSQTADWRLSSVLCYLDLSARFPYDVAADFPQREQFERGHTPALGMEVTISL